jgi:hypothetical protein
MAREWNSRKRERKEKDGMRKELEGFDEFQVIRPARYADWRPRAEQVEDVGNAFAYSTQACLNVHIILIYL